MNQLYNCPCGYTYPVSLLRCFKCGLPRGDQAPVNAVPLNLRPTTVEVATNAQTTLQICQRAVEQRKTVYWVMQAAITMARRTDAGRGQFTLEEEIGTGQWLMAVDRGCPEAEVRANFDKIMAEYADRTWKQLARVYGWDKPKPESVQ